jgi:hypothetical protein
MVEGVGRIRLTQDSIHRNRTIRAWKCLLLFTLDTLWIQRKWDTCLRLGGTFCSHANGNGICKICFYVITSFILLLGMRFFSDTGSYAFSGQGRIWNQQHVISDVFVTKERRVSLLECEILQYGKLNITFRQVESAERMPIVRVRP